MKHKKLLLCAALAAAACWRRTVRARGLLSLFPLLWLCLPLAGWADADLIQAGQITINPSSSPVVLTLQGPAFDSAAEASYGLILSYHDSTSGNATASALFRLFRPAGQYQWQLSTGNDARLAMQLGNDHSLTLYDPQNPNQKIVLRPGTGQDSGVFFNGQALAIAGSTVPLVTNGLSVAPNGAVGIGTTTPVQKLDVNGGVKVGTNLYLQRSSDPLASGAIYLGDQPILFTPGNFVEEGYGVSLGTATGSATANNVSYHNVSIGANVMSWYVTTGSWNVGVGSKALEMLTTGCLNIAIGRAALKNTSTGLNNIGIGFLAGANNISGSHNIAVGWQAAFHSTAACNNIVIGFNAGYGLVSGSANVAIGDWALAPQVNWVPQDDGNLYLSTAIGVAALENTTGPRNTALGAYAGLSNTTGQCNTFLGICSGCTDNTTSTPGNLTNATAVGAYAQVTASNSVILGGTGDYAANVGIGTTAPSAKLHVIGNSKFAGDVSVAGTLRVRAAGDVGMGDFIAGSNPTPP